VSGNVTAAAQPTDALVAARQTLTNGTTVTVAETVSDSTSGAYTLTLPAAPPWVAPYVAAPASYAFATDLNAGVSYTLKATSNGMSQTAGPVAIAAGITATANFVF